MLSCLSSKVFLFGQCWIFQRQFLSRLQSLCAQCLIAASTQYLDGDLFEFRTMPDVGNRPACFPEKCGGRYHDAVDNAVYRHPDDRSHSGRKARVTLCQRHFNAKIPGDGPTSVEIQAGRRANRVDATLKVPVGNGLDAHSAGLSQFQLAPLCLLNPSGNLERRWVWKLRDGSTGPRAVSRLERCGSALWLPVVLQCDNTIKRRL